MPDKEVLLVSVYCNSGIHRYDNKYVLTYDSPAHHGPNGLGQLRLFLSLPCHSLQQMNACKCLGYMVMPEKWGRYLGRSGTVQPANEGR
jgi:hypothetical protein